MAGFQVKLTGGKQVRANISKALKGGSKAAQEGARQAAHDLLVRSQELAPILTGALIASSQVVETGTRRKRFAVTYGTGHAVFAHEEIAPAGSRGLGPLSREKEGSNRSPDGPVGGHFLSRPFQRRLPAYLKGIQKATARGLARKPVGRLFRRGVRRG